MNARILGLTIACMAALSLCIFISADVSDADDEPPQIDYLHGFVYESPEMRDNQPMEGVVVSTWASLESTVPISSDTTSGSGEFKVKYDDDVKYISFKMVEFSVIGGTDELYRPVGNNTFELKLNESKAVSDNTYELYSETFGYSALMSRTTAYIYGVVSADIGDSATPIKNATVSLSSLDSSQDIFTAKTNENGYFNISCSTGVEYKMTVKASGFETYEIDSIVPSDIPNAILLEEKNHMIIFGLDLAHTMAIVGVTIMIVLALVAIYMIRRPETADGIYVINDIRPRRKNKE